MVDGVVTLDNDKINLYKAYQGDFRIRIQGTTTMSGRRELTIQHGAGTISTIIHYCQLNEPFED